MESTGFFASHRPSRVHDVAPSTRTATEHQGKQTLPQLVPRPLSALEELKSIKDEDAMPIINHLIEISNVDQWYIQMLRQGAITTTLDNRIAGASKRPVMAPLVSIGSTSAMVFSTVLKQSSGVALEIRFYLALLSNLRRDLSKGESQYLSQRLENPVVFPERDFFFWRAFIGALSLCKARTIFTIHQGIDNARICSIEELQFCFEGFIKRWSESIGGIRDWSVAQETLARTAWPEDQVDRKEAEMIWSRAMSWPNAVPESKV